MLKKKNEKMVCATLCEISRSFLRASSCLRIFVRGLNIKKRAFFLGLSVGLSRITHIDVNVKVGGRFFFRNLFTEHFLLKGKVNNGKGKVVSYLKVMITGIKHPSRTFVFKYTLLHLSPGFPDIYSFP